MGGRIKPMNDIEILREMLVCNNDVQVPLHPGQGKSPSVELEDNQANTTVKITGLPDDSIVIGAETFETPVYVFKGLKGERKRADFVIVSNDKKGRKWIICIEIQTKEWKTAKHVTDQLKGAICVVKYCQCIGKTFWKENNFLNDYNYRFVSVICTSINKKGTQYKVPPSLWDSPEHPWKIPGTSHYFNKLIGK